MSDSKNVSTKRSPTIPLEPEVYRRSEANIRRLNEKLPEELVVDLAREVIMRVASKEDELSHIPLVTTQADLESLCEALISNERHAAANMINGLRADGVRVEDIYIKQLAGAARMLGDWWVSDKVSFSQVTVGTGRMLTIMRGMRHLFEPSVPAQVKTALFAAVPGENHTLGVHMAADMFRKDGWEITLKVGLDHDQLVSEIEQTPTGIVGFSLGGSHSIDALSRLVVALHICCPQAIIVVYGPCVEEQRDILSLMGLDGFATTLEEARVQLAELWDANMAG